MSDLEAFLADLRSEFRQQMDARIEGVEHASAALGSGDEAGRRQLILHAHKLSGLGATFGFAELGRLADAVEQAAEAGAEPACLQDSIVTLLTEMRRVASGGQ